MTTTLELKFSSYTGKNRTLTVQDPVLDLTDTQAREAMENIIAQNMFQKNGDRLYDSIKGARYVNRTVADIFEEQ